MIAINETSGKSIPSRNRLIPTNTSYLPCLNSLIIFNLSSVLTSVFGDPIEINSTLILSTNNFYPSTSILSTIDCHVQEYASGISTIKINDDILTGTISAYYLSTGTTLVNTLNGKTGNISNILTGIKVDNNIICSQIEVDLGEFFEQGTPIVSSINNDLIGDQWVISSLAINGKVYSSLNNQYLIQIDDNFGSNLYKREQTLQAATISTTTDENSIVNLQAFKNAYIISGIVSAGINTFNNVWEWISITDQNYNLIIPNSVTLIIGTLTVDSPSAGIIYYLSKI